jgi:hypothetical protein
VPRANRPGRSVLGDSCATWLRQLVHAGRVSRLYSTEVPNPVVEDARQVVHAALADLLERFGPLTFRFTPTEIFLGEECIIGPGDHADVAVRKSDEEQLAALLFGDGIRQIRFLPDVPRSDVEALIDALRDAGMTTREHDDLVTLLWQSGLTHAVVASVPSELRTTLEPDVTAEGRHQNRFDDRRLPTQGLDVDATLRELETTAAASRARLLSAWRNEAAAMGHRDVGTFVRELLALDSGEDMRRAVTRFVVSWLPDSIVKGNWAAAHYALELLREIEPDPTQWSPMLAATLSKLDPVFLAERLERSEGSQVSAFIEVALAMGPAAVDMVCSVMAEAEEPASRAATEVALAILCANAPDRLEPYLHDPRWYVVRNAAQVLGMVGGDGVGRLLRIAIGHSDERVVREAISSLARAPREEGLPVLIELLHTRDLRVLDTTLSVLTREKNPAAARALLSRIESPEFESEDEALQRQVFSGLGEIAGDESVFALAALVQKPGLFVKQTLVRRAAAQTLARIGTVNARDALQTGLKSKHEAVRTSCREALGQVA